MPETMDSGELRRAPRKRQTPDGFEQRLLTRARAIGLTQGDRLVVGFSGGRDSLALAAALRRVALVLGIEPALVHVDHQLRSASGEEAKQAARLGAALGVEVHVCPVAEVPTAIHPAVGVEEAARRERYRILVAEAERFGARAVVTAHHQSDQAETVLLHLLRGGGVHGAAAMSEWGPAPVRDISQEISAVRLWRPLLRESRAAIGAYLKNIGLTPIEDPSNEDQTLRRNVLRHRILPLLEETIPGATSALARYAGLASEDDHLLDEFAVKAMAGIVDPGGRLHAKRLTAQPLALQRRVVRNWLQRVTGSASFTAERTEAIVALASSGVGSDIEVGEGWTVRRRRGMLHAERTAGAEKRSGA